MTTVNRTGLEVIEVQSLESKMVLVAKLIYGEIHTRMIFESGETGNLFQVVGISFIPADALVQGKRALTLKPLNHQEKCMMNKIARVFLIASISCAKFLESAS